MPGTARCCRTGVASRLQGDEYGTRRPELASPMRDLQTIDAELRLLAAAQAVDPRIRRRAPVTRQVDKVLDERTTATPPNIGL
jgi:hypothetical protein